jgi:transketolase
MNLEAKRFELRKVVLDMVYNAKTGHIGGGFSCMDILISLYYKHMNISPETVNDKNRDRFILSKGHSVEALYAVLADLGFLEKSELTGYSTFGSKLIGHPNNKINGIEICSGSLGHGLPVAVGMALAGKMDALSYKTYVVMGDGELAEGSVWEAVMAAGHFSLDNLTVFVDLNGLQISGTTEEVMTHRNLAAQFESFGWAVITCNGNDLISLDNAIYAAGQVTDMPSVIICGDIKGYGVSFIENNYIWHHHIPTDDEYMLAAAELKAREERAYE